MLHDRRGLDSARPFFRLLCSAIFATAVAGCAGTSGKMSLPWWTQGPGGGSGEALRPLAEPPREATQTDTVLSSSAQPANNQAQSVHYGHLVFVSGQIADDPVSLAIVGSDTQAQMRTAMDNLARILEGQGLTVSNILSVTLYMQDIDELPKADAVYATYFKGSLPARSVVRVDGLPKGSLIEIAAIAGK